MDNPLKEKNDNLDLSKLKTFVLQKIMFKRMIKQVIECNKIFVNHISNKGLASSICKEVSKHNVNKQIIQLENGQNSEKKFYHRGYTDDKNAHNKE